MEILKSLFLGIIQGVAEFLPISSSGHLSLLSHLFKFDLGTAGLFSAMLHMGTLVAILMMFYKQIYALFEELLLCVRDIASRSFTLKLDKLSPTRKMLFMFVISCVPLLILLLPVGDGNTLMDAVDVFSTDDSVLAEGICFMFTGFILILGVTLAQGYKTNRKISPVSALVIGFAQLLAACFPGISRSGSTISAGLCCGVSKQSAVRYSFILSIPAVVVGGLVEFKDAMEENVIVPVFPLIVGFVSSAVVGVFAIKLIQVLIRKDLFRYFGYYCLALGFITTIVSAISRF